MNNQLSLLINNLTQDIIESFGIQIPIKDMNDIVNKLGGCIKEQTEVHETSSSVKKQDNSFVILISSFQNEERKRFAIAHEIGHLFLHMGYKIDDGLWISQKNTEYNHSGDVSKEYEANEFAAALLMPQKEYKKVMEENTKDDAVDTKKIAEYFRVSTSAASNRGKMLGYLQ